VDDKGNITSWPLSFHTLQELHFQVEITKLQYPNVRETIRSDLAMARVLFRPLFKGDNIDI